jgi:DNA-binding GntR family transcriptional regulator
VALPRLNQRTTPDHVAEVLREAILDGSLKSGSQLRETHIATELGVSRAPLREALTRLEEEGLVEKIPFRGAFVAEVSQRSVDEIANLRAILEPYAAELAFDTLRTTKLSYLRDLVRRLTSAAKAGNVQQSIDAHLAFHRAFYESADNDQLLSLWRGWESQLRLFLAVDMRSFDDPMQIAAEHASMLAMIESGDEKALRREFGRHIHGTGSLPPTAAKRRVAPSARAAQRTRKAPAR